MFRLPWTWGLGKIGWRRIKSLKFKVHGFAVSFFFLTFVF